MNDLLDGMDDTAPGLEAAWQRITDDLYHLYHLTEVRVPRLIATSVNKRPVEIFLRCFRKGL